MPRTREKLDGNKERASLRPSYLLNGPGPVQKKEDARASPEGGRVVPRSLSRARWNLSPGACGGPTPRTLLCGTRGCETRAETRGGDPPGQLPRLVTHI